MNTRAVTQENACARAREIFAPRFPKNFPKNFRVSFSRFVFAFRFRVSFFQRVGIYAMNTRTAPNVHASRVSC